MKLTLLCALAAASLVSSLAASAADFKQEVLGAVKALAEKENYSWRTTTVVPPESAFKPGPVEGRAEKKGLTSLTLKVRDTTTLTFLQGDKAVASTEAGGWQTLSELDSAQGPRAFLGVFLRNFKNPIAQATELLALAKELRKEGETYAGELTDEGAKTLLTFRPRNGVKGPEVSNARGTIKYWIKDGVLSQYEFHVQGKVSYNENELNNERTTTVEIKDVGSTKLDVPEDAKKKLS